MEIKKSSATKAKGNRLILSKQPQQVDFSAVYFCPESLLYFIKMCTAASVCCQIQEYKGPHEK